MSENPDATRSTDGYDPATDPDADPDSLSPRTGAAAIPAPDEGDPDADADADLLNPRDG